VKEYTSFRRKNNMLRSGFLLLGTAMCVTGCTTGGPALREMNLGWVDRAVLDGPHHPEYRATYDTSHIDAQFVEMVRQVHEGADILVFFGIWCSDSKRELPRFLKLADLSGIPRGRVRLYALDRKKKSPGGLEARYSIERVPTFIFLRGEKETGRIVERPRSTLEGDVLMILASAPPDS
jgi:hypothetical protein